MKTIKVDIDQLDGVAAGLEQYTAQAHQKVPTLASLQSDLVQLCEVERMLIRRIQYLEAELQELRA